MKLTTLCYIEKDNQYLMLHRTKKENDQSHDKWLGIGGKIEKDESPEDCMKREILEETGLTVTSFTFAGVITFISDVWETEYMFLYVVDGFTGEMITCDEGDLQWIPKQDVMKLNLWEGDRIFINRLLKEEYGFSIRYVYKSDDLVQVTGTVTDKDWEIIERYRNDEGTESFL